jgi:hypothetical protein
VRPAARYLGALAMVLGCPMGAGRALADAAGDPSPGPSTGDATSPRTADPAPSREAPAADPTPPTRRQRRPRRPWHLVLTPMAGVLRNTIRFEYEVPTGPDEVTPRSKELEDTGAGTALSAVFVYRRLALTNVFFVVPRVNSSLVIGNVFFATWSHPLHRVVELFTGVGMAIHGVRTHLVNFEDTVTKEGVSATAHFDSFRVKNDVFAPFPKIGLRFNLPVQHWYVAPWVSYLFEGLRLEVSSPGGSVYIPDPVNETKIIPPIFSQKWKYYHSALVGADLFLDFHYALQLRVKFYYNATFQKVNLRVIGSAILSRRVPLGLTFYLEYSQGIIHDNLYGFIGPSYMF